MDETAYQQSMADFKLIADKWANRLEPQTAAFPSLSNEQFEALALQLKSAADEMLTFLDEGEMYGAEGRTELLVQVTRQLENLGNARLVCQQIADDRRQTYQG